MNKILRMEYQAPKTTFISLPEISVICASQSTASSIESFVEDDELDWI